MDWFIADLAPWISLLAVIVIQQIINLVINWQNLKQRRLEQKYETEIMAYREFARTYGGLRFTSSDRGYWEFAGAANQVAVMCGDGNVRNHIFSLLDMMKTNHYPTDETDKIFQECVVMLASKVKR